MKVMHDGADITQFTREDILTLIQKLNSKDKKILKAYLKSLNKEEKRNTFPYIRTWVLRKFYPDVFKTSLPFYNDVMDILNVDE